jgi:hypothetical protein
MLDVDYSPAPPALLAQSVVERAPAFSATEAVEFRYQIVKVRRQAAALPNSPRPGFSSGRELSLRYIEVHGAVRRMIFRAVDGLHHQAIRARFQVVHFYFHSDGDHGVPLLDEVISANELGKE